MVRYSAGFEVRGFEVGSDLPTFLVCSDKVWFGISLFRAEDRSNDIISAIVSREFSEY